MIPDLVTFRQAEGKEYGLPSSPDWTKQEGRIDLLRSFSSDAMAWPDICTRHFGHNHSLLLACQRKIGRGKDPPKQIQRKLSFKNFLWLRILNKQASLPFFFGYFYNMLFSFCMWHQERMGQAGFRRRHRWRWNKASTVFKSDLKRF